jgi:imidazole glycerol-phosphate synthase subunit HisF
MLTRRIIPCLDVRDGRVVKGVKFQSLRDAGSPSELARLYEEQGADELVLLDVSATPEGRATQADTVRRVRREISIPLTVGGGVRTTEDAARLLEAGADKVGVNTAAVNDPNLLSVLAEQFGRQCTVLAVDAKQTGPSAWQVVTLSGQRDTGLSAVEWVRQACELGAGEILLTSWDRDGTGEGYDLDLVRAVSEVTTVPVIASGGGRTFEQLHDGFLAGADAVLAASIFHFRERTVGEIKDYLAEHGVEVRR